MSLGELVSPSQEKVEPSERPAALYLSLEHIESGTGRILGHGVASEVASTKNVFRAGDLLYGKLRPYLNKVCVPDFDGICSTDILVFPKSAFVDSRYLLRFLMLARVVEFANHNMSGVQLPRIKFKTLAELRVPLPPLIEQNRIVARIEDLSENASAATARLAKVTIALKRFRQVVLAAACSGQLTASWREGHVEVRDGALLLKRLQLDRAERLPTRKPVATQHESPFEIPETWAWGRWHDLVDWITYGFTRPMPHVETGVPIVTAKNITGSGIDFRNVDHTTNDAFRELSEKDRPRRGEILVTKDGSIGRAAIVDTDDPFCINQSVAVLRFGGPSAYVPFLLRVIEAPFTQSLIDAGAKGSAIRHISITAFASFACPLPPMEEQREIVRRVEVLFSLADVIEACVGRAATHLEGLMQAILAKAFLGELVPSEAESAAREDRDYEPASVLKDRIQEGRKHRKPARGGRGGKNMAKRSAGRQPATSRRALDEILREQGKPLTPERLLDLTGLEEDSLDGFYEQLRMLVQEGRIREDRPNRKDVYLRATGT